MDTLWAAIGAIGAVTAALIAAWAAGQSRLSSTQANAAATTLARIETERRHGELTPHFRVIFAPAGSGMSRCEPSVKLVGPAGLNRIDNLTLTILDDHFRRADATNIVGSVTKEQIERQIWGPYRLVAGVGPDDSRADETGWQTVYNHPIPVGEELPFPIDTVPPPPWSQLSPTEWQNMQKKLRFALNATHSQYGTWRLVG